MLIGLVFALGAAILFGGSAVLQAVAVRRSGLISWLMVLVSVGYVAGWLMHLVAIALLPLYLAQMAVGGSLAVTALVAARVVHEPMPRRHWYAIGAMLVGFALLISSAGPVGLDDQHADLTLVLYLAFAVLLVAGLLTLAWRRRRSGIVLGLLAGLSYAGAPIATRALIHPEFDVHTLVHALPIALFGTLGFVLQSTALERVTVTAAIAPMVLLETFVPALIGVLLFQDEVRRGWGLVCLLAFLVATGGALVLSSAEESLEQLEETPPTPPSTQAEAHA